MKTQIETTPDTTEYKNQIDNPLAIIDDLKKIIERKDIDLTVSFSKYFVEVKLNKNSFWAHK